MNELILKIDDFKQQIAYSINNSQLPAEITRWILQDFVNVLNTAAQAQLVAAKQVNEKEDENDGKSS